MWIATRRKKDWRIVVVAVAVAVAGAAWISLRANAARDVDAADREAVVALVQSWADGRARLLSGEAHVETRLHYPPHVPADYAGSADRIVALAVRSGDGYALSAVVPDHSADNALGLLDVRPQEVGLAIAWDEQADELRARC